MNQTLLIRNIARLVTCDDSDRILRDAAMFVRNGVICAVCEDEMLPSLLLKYGVTDLSAIPTIDARGYALYPGLVNTHHHFYQIFSRNLPEVQKHHSLPFLRHIHLTPPRFYITRKWIKWKSVRRRFRADALLYYLLRPS